MGKSPDFFDDSGDVGRPSLMDKYQFFAYFEPMVLDSNRDLYFNNFIERYKTKAIVGFVLIPMLYFVLLGATLGKFLTGIRVKRKDGAKISISIAFVRHAGRIFSTLLMLLGFLLALKDERRQTFHDKIAHTVVINNEPGLNTVAQFETA